MDNRYKKHNGYLTGRLLISTPKISDTMFYKSVVLVCLHDANGAMGLVLNKLENVYLNTLFTQMDLPAVDTKDNLRIHRGGIVDVNHGFILHDTAYREKATVAISDQFCLTATVGILKKISQKKGPKKCLIALGYAGWGKGQLEQEIIDNAWLSVPSSHHIVFDTSVDSMWYTALVQNSIEPSKIAVQTGRA